MTKGSLLNNRNIKKSGFVTLERIYLVILTKKENKCSKEKKILNFHNNPLFPHTSNSVQLSYIAY